MQIGDALGRYNTNMQTGTSGAAGAQRTAATGSTSSAKNADLSGLKAGNVFEGTVGTMKNGQVQIQLANGSSINARLGADVPITQGQSLFFEVKSNEGGLIEIRPFTTEGGMNNPTLLSALNAAGLTPTADHMNMVNTLMQEGMPIDKQSLGAMARLIGNNPGIDQTTLIEMTKLGIPITDEMAAQFENYKTDSHQILNKMSEILESVSNTLGGEQTDGAEALALNDKLVSILTGEEETLEAAQAGKTGETAAAQGMPTEATGQELAATAEEAAAKKGVSSEQAVLSEEVKNEGAATENKLPTEETKAAAAQNPEALTKAAEQDPAKQHIIAQNAGQEKAALPGTVKEILSPKETATLEQALRTLDQDGTLSKAGLHTDMSAEKFVKTLNEALKNLPEPDAKALKELLSGKEYLSVLKEVARQQWTVKPEQLSGDRIKDLYENLDRQMKQTETMLREMGLKDTELAKSVTDLKNNLEFMDQVNQTYTYLQIPLRFQNQTAHSDLYVYTNKKNLQDPDAELSAFLHLDMEHLGSTDVSVKMQHRAVNTKFYLEDDAAFDLIMAHADELMERLEEKGYHCQIDAVSEPKEMNFVEDFMKAGQSAGHMIHRYSFDIKA